MAANIDINRDQGSTSTMTFTIVDEGGNAVDITNWTEFELVPFVSPAKEYTRYATFSDTGGGTFTETVRVIVGDTGIDPAYGNAVETSNFEGVAFAHVISQGKPMKVRVFDMYINSRRDARIDFSLVAGRTSATLLGSFWEVEEGASVSLGTNFIAGNATQTQLITSGRTGEALVRCVGYFDNDEIVPEYILIRVTDPDL